jgi:hypothetical protein
MFKKPLVFWVRILFFTSILFITASIAAFNAEYIETAGFLIGLSVISVTLFFRFLGKYLLTLPIGKKIAGIVSKLLSGALRGIKMFFTDVVGGVARKIGHVLDRILPKNIFKLTVFKDERISLRGGKQKMRNNSPYRRMKWKDLKTDTDKVRFAYYFFMRKKMKKGYVYRPSQTPSEVCGEIWRNEGAFNAVELFDMYNVYRYDDTVNTNGAADRLLPYTK